MRILGLDFGSKTVGVAVSDGLLLTAQNDLRDLILPDQLLDPGTRLAQFVLILALDRLHALGCQKKSVTDRVSLSL